MVPAQRGGRNTEPLLHEGYLLRDRWLLKKKIGGGGFGQIYMAHDQHAVSEDEKLVAVKLGSRVSQRNNARMVLETLIIIEAHEHALHHSAKFYGSGQEPVHKPTVNFIVMQLLGPSLSEMRKKRPAARLSRVCAVQCLIQCFESLRDLHSIGYLHRDVKPSNFAIGRTPATSSIIYLIDFGLSRRIVLSGGQGSIRKKRTSRVGFRGTSRYASISAHDRIEQGRGDDLMSAYYGFIELLNGKLPWRDVHEQPKIREMKVACMENETQRTQLYKYVPRSLQPLGDTINAIDYDTEPNYEHMIGMLRQCLKELAGEVSEGIDWDDSV